MTYTGQPARESHEWSTRDKNITPHVISKKCKGRIVKDEIRSFDLFHIIIFFEIRHSDWLINIKKFCKFNSSWLIVDFSQKNLAMTPATAGHLFERMNQLYWNMGVTRKPPLYGQNRPHFLQYQCFARNSIPRSFCSQRVPITPQIRGRNSTTTSWWTKRANPCIICIFFGYPNLTSFRGQRLLITPRARI